MKKQDFKSAESRYTQAILIKEEAPLFSNRAMARIKLQMFDGALSDAN
jgi:hypothetical protein